MTLAASSLTLKARRIARMKLKPSNATAEEQLSFSVNSTSLQSNKKTATTDGTKQATMWHKELQK